MATSIIEHIVHYNFVNPHNGFGCLWSVMRNYRAKLGTSIVTNNIVKNTKQDIRPRSKGGISIEFFFLTHLVTFEHTLSTLLSTKPPPSRFYSSPTLWFIVQLCKSTPIPFNHSISFQPLFINIVLSKSVTNHGLQNLWSQNSKCLEKPNNLIFVG